MIMTTAEAITEVRHHCETLIERHSYSPTLDACDDCGRPYTCQAHLAADKVIASLDQLELVDLSAAPVAEGSSIDMRERSMIVETKGLRVDLTDAVWKKSARSGGNSDNCVEVAFVDDAIAVRDSKSPAGPVLVYTRDEWAAFIGGVRDGEFDRA